MNLWQKMALEKLLPRSFPIIRWLITLVLVLSLASCGEKVGSQEVPTGYQETPTTIAETPRQFSEVSPPDVIQELRSTLEVYQPQVTIITPQPDEVLQDNKVKVSLQVKDLPIFKDPQWQLGPHLHLILDNQPYIAVYDLNQPLVLPDLAPGTHTLRVFASRPWHESFKNDGAYAQTTFHIFTKTDDNNPDPSLPLLTYSRPKDNYGAEPILLDFYLTNAPLHLVAEDNPQDEVSDWRIRCTINGESFILDRWQAVYLKGFKPGKNWVKLEFLDNQGNPVKNVFNSTVRLITYEPKGKDTLSRIIRGELKADEVRGIVDPNYTTKIPPAEPTPTPTVEQAPTPQPEIEEQPVPEIEVPEIPKTPTVEKVPEVQPEVEKQPVPEIEVPEIPKTPTVEKVPEVQPEVEKQPVPEIEVPETPKTPTVEKVPEVQPEVEKQPVPEIEVPEIPKTPTVEKVPAPQPQVEEQPVPEIEVPEIPKTPTVEKAPEVEKQPVPEIEVPEIPKTPTVELPEKPITQVENSQLPTATPAAPEQPREETH
ncbi:hypothetical protein NIES4074_18810 [Cylindrospermum sp. NIES-4074]|nr:hypothetical protein NIES4074_18810 [Cylindrospermum sp. NIES-4074]